MFFPNEYEPDNLYWWEMISDFPDLGEGFEELSDDPEAGVVAAVGIFTMLKLRYWHRLPGPLSDTIEVGHRSDDSLPPQGR